MARKRLVICPWDGNGLRFRPLYSGPDDVGLVWKSVKNRFKSGGLPEPALYIHPGKTTRIANIGDIILMWEDGEYFDNLQYLDKWDGL